MSHAAFLDLHGTLVLPLAVDRLDELRVIPGAEDAVARLCAAGFVCPVVTVQSRIAKGAYSEAEFRAWFDGFARQMQGAGGRVSPYICPHRFSDPCACKKPQALLYEQAARDLEIDLHASFVVGDTSADVEAAQRFGGRGYLLRDGATLADAVEWILGATPAHEAHQAPREP